MSQQTKKNQIILHIPHSSTFIPEHYSAGWIGDPDEAIRIITDHYTDELFDHPAAQRVISPISRIVCDVERFETGEEMEDSFGMGIVYERDHLQNILRTVTADLKNEIVESYYRPHHRALYDAVTETLSMHGKSVIVDCHSFNDEQLPHVTSTVRPDFCIGSDSYHTPPELVNQLVKYLNDCGYCVTVNEPFAGTIVPLDYYCVNPDIISIMIEVNKRLYLDDQIKKNTHFETIKAVITDMLKLIYNFKT
jgi:N-formylglutamate amidohydrolase